MGLQFDLEWERKSYAIVGYQNALVLADYVSKNGMNQTIRDLVGEESLVGKIWDVIKKACGWVIDMLKALIRFIVDFVGKLVAFCKWLFGKKKTTRPKPDDGSEKNGNPHPKKEDPKPEQNLETVYSQIRNYSKGRHYSCPLETRPEMFAAYEAHPIISEHDYAGLLDITRVISNSGKTWDYDPPEDRRLSHFLNELVEIFSRCRSAYAAPKDHGFTYKASEIAQYVTDANIYVGQFANRLQRTKEYAETVVKATKTFQDKLSGIPADLIPSTYDGNTTHDKVEVNKANVFYKDAMYDIEGALRFGCIAVKHGYFVKNSKNEKDSELMFSDPATAFREAASLAKSLETSSFRIS